MKALRLSGYNLVWGKRRNKPGLEASITDTSPKLGKTAYIKIRAESVDKETRDRLLIMLGEELQYLKQTETDPTQPYTGKTTQILEPARLLEKNTRKEAP